MDVVFAALAQAVPVPAQGQGTMNNVVLGNERFTYYETIAGGQGACPDARRPLGRARRDVEHAEHAGRGARARVPAPRRALRAPPRLGRRRAATAAETASSASSASSSPAGSRSSPSAARSPRAAATGGGDGLPGRNLLNGEELPAFATVDLEPGDLLRIETPGGGGYGTGGKR